VALSASPRARRPGCPRLPRADGCQRGPSPRTAAVPARRNRQPRIRQGGGLLRSASSGHLHRRTVKLTCRRADEWTSPHFMRSGTFNDVFFNKILACTRPRILLRGFHHDDARIKIIRLRIQSWCRQQLLSLAVVEIDVSFALAAEPFRDEGDVASVGGEGRRILVCPRIEAG